MLFINKFLISHIHIVSYSEIVFPVNLEKRNINDLTKYSKMTTKKLSTQKNSYRISKYTKHLLNNNKMFIIIYWIIIIIMLKISIIVFFSHI